jgi:AcrR family transcriptional regulator
MSGRRQQQKRDRERALREAATRLFASQGYAASSMEDIAARAGLAVGTVYNYFPAKSELLLAILRAEVREVSEAVEAITKELPADPGDALIAVFESYLELLLRHDRALWREMLGAALATPDTVGRGLFESDLELLGQLVRVLAELQSRGAIGDRFEPGRAAVALYSTFITSFMAWVASDDLDLDNVRAQIRNGVEILLHGLLAGAPQRTNP